MLARFNLLFFALSLVFITACNSDDSEKPMEKEGKVRIEIVHTVNGIPFSLDSQIYKSKAGNKYSISRIMYYLSNFSFESKACKTFTPEPNYHLIFSQTDPNYGDPSNNNLYEKLTFTYKLPVGCYEEVRMGLGVDSNANEGGSPFSGDLGSIWNMSWEMAKHYKFLVHEGTFENDTMGNSNFIHHLGFSRFYQERILDLTKDLIIEEGETTILKLNVDLGQILNSQHIIDLNESKTAMSANQLTRKLMDNWASAFSFDEN